MLVSHIREHLHLWNLDFESDIRLINLSENHTFLISTESGTRHVLRVHRPNYNSAQDVLSELEWMRALRADAALFTPKPIAGINGECVQNIETSENTRLAVLFAFEEGEEPQQGENLVPAFRQLGEIAAQCHQHARSFVPSPNFRRMEWSDTTVLGADGQWGDWRTSQGVDEAVRSVLEAACEKLTQDLYAYGRSSDRFGLIHADMRLANLLVHEGRVKLIDFDDCGFGWYMYDFAAAISFMETSPDVPQLLRAWLDGYRKFRDLSEVDVGIIQSMILLRRMALQAWLGTHRETELVKSLEAEFAQGTLQLAQSFLQTGKTVQS